MNRPTAVELLRALDEHLSEVVQPRLAGTEAYQNRVAENLIQILERELTLGAASSQEERIRLRALMGVDGDLPTLNARLCELIASGALQSDDPGLMSHLRLTACAKLAVDNPYYPAYLRLLEAGSRAAGETRDST